MRTERKEYARQKAIYNKKSEDKKRADYISETALGADAAGGNGNGNNRLASRADYQKTIWSSITASAGGRKIFRASQAAQLYVVWMERRRTAQWWC